MNPNTREFNRRKDNFCKALSILNKQAQRNDFSDENIGATLHFFEITFELAWKLLKDYLNVEGGIIAKTPRQVLKHAFQADFIKEGHLWIDM
ncbi:MAG: nucleotidyltransferase substrate binding protein, partial [Defluviitaleaceae bacterium]|nr:nucleotidyltransferase substrate binding protein [Defluviitaleaceae bacterium]